MSWDWEDFFFDDFEDFLSEHPWAHDLYDWWTDAGPNDQDDDPDEGWEDAVEEDD